MDDSSLQVETNVEQCCSTGYVRNLVAEVPYMEGHGSDLSQSRM
jgi:hypothetical protein